MADLVSDGIELEALARAMDPDTARAPRGADRFWSTEERYQEDSTREVLEFRLNGPRRINYLMAKVANFPHVVTIERYDDEGRVWLPVITRRIFGSIPARIMTQADDKHPQHRGHGHWVKVSERVTPFTAERVRAVLVRGSGTPPIGLTGEPVAYSLGVRDFDIGYRVYDKADIPKPKVRTVESDFASSLDLLGSRVSFSLREQRVRGLVEDTVKPWRCEPQPVNYAVVNLYADTRGTDGEAQPIDRFFLDPLTPGVSTNIYWSNDDPDGTFRGESNPLEYPLSQIHGQVVAAERWMSLGFDQPGYIDISNREIQWRPSRSWWIGTSFYTRFLSTDGTERPILDFMGNQVRYERISVTEDVWGTPVVTTTSRIRFTTQNGDSLSAVLPSFDEGANIKVVVAHVTEATETVEEGLHLWVFIGNDGQIGDPIHVTMPVIQPIIARTGSTLRVGGYLGTSPGVPKTRLRALVLKQGLADLAGIEAFIAAPRDYVQDPEYDNDEPRSTDNSLLRFDAVYQETVANPTGFVGGPGDRMAELTWTPIAADYRLRKGYMHVPPTSAKYWKFEFTNLSPEPYQTFVPMNRRVQLFSEREVHQPPPRRGRPTPPGTKTQMSQAVFQRYSDAMRILREVNNYFNSPTEAVFTRDPDAAQRLRDASWVFSFQPWHQGGIAPRFVQTEKHHYETVRIRHTTKVGYFVGLKAIRAYRVDYTAEDDTEQIIEHFNDDLNLIENSWLLADGGLDSGESSYVSAASRVFASRRTVRGVQFATQQSDPIQIAPDDNFEDPDLATTEWDNIYSWHQVGDASLEYDQETLAVVVRRAVSRQYYDDLNDSTYGALEAYTYATLEEQSTLASAFGGISSRPILPGLGGRLYAAARVTALTELTSPIYLQIFKSDNETPMVSADQFTTEITVAHIPEAWPEVPFTIHLGAYTNPEAPLEDREQVTVTAINPNPDTSDPVYHAQWPWILTVVRGVNGTTPVLAGGYASYNAPGATALGEVLSEQPLDIAAGETAEWWTTHSIAQSGSLEPVTYGSLEGQTYAQLEDEGGVPATYGNIESDLDPYQGAVRVRLVQKGESQDEFRVERLSLFDEGIVWEFTVGGDTWHRADGTRNHPHGMLTFPTPGDALRWRVRGYRHSLAVSALKIRPWYSGILPGQARSEVRGPNESWADEFADVTQDPDFHNWQTPIPQWWYLERGVSQMAVTGGLL